MGWSNWVRWNLEDHSRFLVHGKEELSEEKKKETFFLIQISPEGSKSCLEPECSAPVLEGLEVCRRHALAILKLQGLKLKREVR